MKVPFAQHPCLPPVTQEEILAIVSKHGAEAPAVFQEIERRRRELIAQAEADPLRYGWVLEPWRDALEQMKECVVLAIFGGNGASKTWFAVWEALQTMVREPQSRVLFLHESEQSSIDVHQAIAYHFLPPEMKPRDGWKPKKTTTTNIVYDNKNGFSGSAFSLANGSKAVFGYYTQPVKYYEGGGWKRVVADEDMPLSWLTTFKARLPRARGKLAWCFTPIAGITPAIREVVNKAKTIEHRAIDPDVLPRDYEFRAEQDWPRGRMPYIQVSLKPQTRIMYFHSEMNPVQGYHPVENPEPGAGYRQLKALYAAEDQTTKTRRFYGVADDTVRSALNLRAEHIAPRERVAAFLSKPCTRYQVNDPAGARNFFLIWYAVDADGRHLIYREWPDVPTYGEWALPSDKRGQWDGTMGPAQSSRKYGIIDYKRMILKAEGWQLGDAGWEKRTGHEEVFQRFIDPRSGATDAMADATGESSLISRFLEEQRDAAGRIVGPSMHYEPALSGRNEDDGLTQINELLSFDASQPLVALLNEPKLLISEDCQNVLWALANYTGADGPKAACKDPVDCTRYMALKRCLHVQMSALRGTSGGGW